MDPSLDAAVWNVWYAIGTPGDIRRRHMSRTQLLGLPIDIDIQPSFFTARSDDRSLPLAEACGYVWVTLGAPSGPPPYLPEFYEQDRLVMNVWSTPLKCSGLRLIDNVIDNAHFPFVHPGILGSVEHAELGLSHPYVDQDGTLWSRSQKAWLPLTQSVCEYTYHITDPYSVVLYIHRPDTPDRFDVLAIFAQPLDEERFIVHKLLAWVKEDWMDERKLKSDQQWISAQDKYVLERHDPKKLPLNDLEVSISVDMASVAYRQWLRDKDVRFGAIR